MARPLLPTTRASERCTAHSRLRLLLMLLAFATDLRGLSPSCPSRALTLALSFSSRQLDALEAARQSPSCLQDLLQRECGQARLPGSSEWQVVEMLRHGHSVSEPYIQRVLARRSRQPKHTHIGACTTEPCLSVCVSHAFISAWGQACGLVCLAS